MSSSSASTASLRALRYRSSRRASEQRRCCRASGVRFSFPDRAAGKQRVETAAGAALFTAGADPFPAAPLQTAEAKATARSESGSSRTMPSRHRRALTAPLRQVLGGAPMTLRRRSTIFLALPGHSQIRRSAPFFQEVAILALVAISARPPGAPPSGGDDGGHALWWSAASATRLAASLPRTSSLRLLGVGGQCGGRLRKFSCRGILPCADP